MHALVLAEFSGTTSGNHLEALNHYRGNFLSVKTLANDLSEYADTDTYIITDNHGLLHGTDTIETVSQQLPRDAWLYLSSRVTPVYVTKHGGVRG
jgi:hypothetical protein